MSRHFKIYTRTGDDGLTGLVGNQRVSKDSPRLWAYGTLDELNAVIGGASAALAQDQSITDPKRELHQALILIQNDLFDLGAELATPSTAGTVDKMPQISTQHVQRLERLIDRLNEELPPLQEFILPGGTMVACLLHQARTVCRRAERYCVHVRATENISDLVIPYLNRLSDALFVMARWVNMRANVGETKWEKHRP